MSTALTTRIPIRDANGTIVDHKEVATYAGLLAQAHLEGLSAIQTRLVQVPDETNGQTAIVEATVQTTKGTFTGIGDANPGNVNRRIIPHLIRMAETRAKARALRDAVNIGIVALEELGGEDDESLEEPSGTVEPLPAPRTTRTPPSRSPTSADPPRDTAAPMTEAQRRWLFRKLAENGTEGEEAAQLLCRVARVRTIAEITKLQASQLIDRWRVEEPRRAS